MAGFDLKFGEEKGTSHLSTDDLQFAEMLAAGLKEAKEIKKNYSITEWANEFFRLRLNTPIYKIEEVLTWYVKHIKGPHVPHAFSAASFRAKFEAIETSMVIDKKINPVVGEITDEAKAIVRELSRLSWPNGVREQLPKVVQVSLNNFHAFQKRLKLLLDKMKAEPLPEGHYPPRLTTFTEYMYKRLFYSELFIKRWMYIVHKKIKDWENFDGDLLRYGFDVDGKQFTLVGLDLAENYAMTPQLFRDFMEKYNADI